MLSHQKQKKNRSGYEDGVSTLYKVGCRMRFDLIRFDLILIRSYWIYVGSRAGSRRLRTALLSSCVPLMAHDARNFDECATLCVETMKSSPFVSCVLSFSLSHSRLSL